MRGDRPVPVTLQTPPRGCVIPTKTITRQLQDAIQAPVYICIAAAAERPGFRVF